MSTKKPLSYQQVKDLITLKVMPLELKALIALQYGTGCRIGELLNYTTRKEKKSLQGLTRDDIEIKATTLIIRLKNFKNQKKKFKDIAISRTSEAWLVKPVLDWLDYNKSFNVFGYSERHARKLIKDFTGFTSHYFRHSRATHLAQVFGFNAYEIQQTLGHSRLDTSQIYVDSKLEDRIKKMETTKFS